MWAKSRNYALNQGVWPSFFNKVNSRSIELTLGDWLGQWGLFQFFALRNSLVVVVLVHYPPAILSYVVARFVACGWIWAETIDLYIPGFIINTSINKQQLPCSVGRHTCPCHITAFVMSDNIQRCNVLWITNYYAFSILVTCHHCGNFILVSLI